MLLFLPSFHRGERVNQLCFLVFPSWGWVWRLQGRSQCVRGRTRGSQQWEGLGKGGCRMGGQRRECSLVCLITPRFWEQISEAWIKFPMTVLCWSTNFLRLWGSRDHTAHTSPWLEFTYHSWCQVTNVLTTRLQVSSLFKERPSSASMIKSPVTLHEVSSWEYRCQQAENSPRPPEGDAEVCERPSMIRILLCLCTFSQKGQIRHKHCQEACVEHSEPMALRHGIMFCFHIACTVCLWLSSSAWFLATLHTYVACNISWCFGGFDRNCVRSEVVAFLFGFFQRQFVEFLQREE